MNTQVKHVDAVTMIPDKIQLVVHYVMVISIENLVQTRAEIQYRSYGNESQSNAREIYYENNLRTSTDLPVSFKAPDVRSENFWNYYHTPDASNRRMFLGDLGYFNYGATNPFPNFSRFFEFMNPFFEKGNNFKPAPQTGTKTVSEPYRYEYPYIGRTTERNFLPPPKPIRASIVKLETITRPPGLYEWENPSEELPHFPNFKPIPVAKPNTLHIDELGFHPDGNVNFKQEPDWHSKPEDFPTTHLINNITSTVYIPSSAEVHQQSVKVIPSTIQQLLVNDESDAKEKLASNEVSSNITLGGTDSSNEESYKGYKSQHKTKELYEGDLKSWTKSQNGTTAVKYKDSNPGAAVGDSGGPTRIQTSGPYRRGNSIKIVTELTLEGLSRNNKTANIPRYPKFINMSDLISYELNKIKRSKVPRPRSDDAEEKEEFLSRNISNRSFTDINASDGLSLDLKILKDTNWDGFTTEVGPGRELTDTISTEKEGDLGRWKNSTERDSSYDFNNSKTNYTEKKEELHDNKTIIVETRVTKSITKVLPATRRRTYKKLRGTNRGGDSLRNIIHQISSRAGIRRNETSTTTASSGEVIPETTEENPPDFTTSHEVSNTSLTPELHNQSPAVVDKILNGSKDELTDDSGSFNSTPHSVSQINATVPQTLFVSPAIISEDTFINTTTASGIQQNFDLANVSHSPEKVDTDGMTTISNTLRSNSQNETESTETKTIRKRKRKRQKLKRRRTGKRRKTTAITDKSIVGLITTEMDSGLQHSSENAASVPHVAL